MSTRTAAARWGATGLGPCGSSSQYREPATATLRKFQSQPGQGSGFLLSFCRRNDHGCEKIWPLAARPPAGVMNCYVFVTKAWPRALGGKCEGCPGRSSGCLKHITRKSPFMCSTIVPCRRWPYVCRCRNRRFPPGADPESSVQSTVFPYTQSGGRRSSPTRAHLDPWWNDRAPAVAMQISCSGTARVPADITGGVFSRRMKRSEITSSASKTV